MSDSKRELWPKDESNDDSLFGINKADWEKWANTKQIIVPRGQRFGKRIDWMAAPIMPLDNMKLDGSGIWGGYDMPSTPEPETKKCDHKPVDVGFMHSKWVCAKCNEDLPEPR